jgi:hypothetical protein
MARPMMRSLRLSLIILFLTASSLCSQDLEDLWESAGDDPSLQLYFESLEENPIDLNTATPERLQEALFLDPLLVAAIIDYRDQHFPLHTLEEIGGVPGVTPAMLIALQPYVTVLPPIDDERIRGGAATRFYRQYPHSRGYSEKIYRGDPWDSGSIIFFSRGNLSAGGVVQKDAGEPHWNDHQILFLRADNLFRHENRLVVGSYRLGFGQGLVISNGFRVASSAADPLAILPRRPLGVREFRSNSESNYFQGIAAQCYLHNITTAAFVSRRFSDASLNDDGDIESIHSGGLHRTTAEDADRDRMREDLWGGNIEVVNDVASVGITGYHSRYNPRIGDTDSITQHFDFEGGTNSVLGVHGGCQLNGARLGGEIALSQSGGKALLIEARYGISSAQVSCIYRRYDPNFQNLHAVTLTEWGEGAKNEEGWLLAAELPLWQGAGLAARADIVRTPWRTYSFPMLRQGNEVVASFSQYLGQSHTFFVRFQASQIDNLDIQTIIAETRSSVRLQWDWQENSARSYRVRWERIRFDTPVVSESGAGWMLYSQMTVANQRRLTGKFRIATFDVPVYGARIYAYEDDIPGRFTNQVFNGTGRRLSGRLEWTIAPSWDIWLKLAATFYDGVETVGSGWDEIPSRRIYDLGIALRWRIY